MPLVDTTGPVLSNVRGAVPRRRSLRPYGTVRPTKAFNNFPAIMRALPEACSAIVVETTELFGNLAQANAPTIQRQRRGDPAPGNLKASKKTSYYKRRGSDLVVTGKVEFGAKDPRGHRYARPLETGSIRRRGGRLYKVTKSRWWMRPLFPPVRARFIRQLSNLESRLPH